MRILVRGLISFINNLLQTFRYWERMVGGAGPLPPVYGQTVAYSRIRSEPLAWNRLGHDREIKIILGQSPL